MGKLYDKYRSWNTLVPAEEPSPAERARMCHEARLRQLDEREEQIDAMRKIGGSRAAEVLSMMADIARDGATGDSTLFGRIPDVILDNVEVLLSDDNPDLRQYALEHYVPLVNRHEAVEDFLESHEETMASIAKDVGRLKKKP